ncbi:hypothetical protein GCM10022407_22090 [Hymenobacter antarcticus]|uniref:Uncharacterized protein n=1 Tax=Hymenobacter antarcticus TaxID=486270 RepID=A0ABP7Q5E3_9BACT
MDTPPPAAIWRAGSSPTKPLCPVSTGPRWVCQRLTGAEPMGGVAASPIQGATTGVNAAFPSERGQAFAFV